MPRSAGVWRTHWRLNYLKYAAVRIAIVGNAIRLQRSLSFLQHL
jgi:hypothetical protein